MSDDDSVSSLTHADSLIWDNHQQPLLNETVGTRRWSVETQHGVLVPDYDLVDEQLRLLPLHPEGRESAASGSVEQLSVTMENVNDVRDRVERALLEIEDDILPFQGRQMTNEKLVSLTAKATSVRRILQDSHLYLAALSLRWRNSLRSERRIRQHQKQQEQQTWLLNRQQWEWQQSETDWLPARS